MRGARRTIDTYMWNIKALAKVAGHKSVPNRVEWVTKSLLEKIKKLPISQYKRFAMAGVKVLSAFGKKNSSWEAAMRDSTDRYGAIRDKQKRTDREAKLRGFEKAGGQAARGRLETRRSQEAEPGGALQVPEVRNHPVLLASSARSARTTSTRVRARGSFTSANTRRRCRTHSTTSCRW